MLKATFKNRYFNSNGNLTFVMLVAGTAREITQYAEAKAKRLGIPVEELQTENGTQLFHYYPDLSQGRAQVKQLNLAISHNGLIVIDNSDAEMAKDKRIETLMESELAKANVQLMLDRKRGVRNAAPATTVTTNAPGTGEEGHDELDENIQLMQGTKIETPAIAGAGAEELND